MRVCIDTSPAVHRRAGLGRYAEELATALLAVDHENEYVAFYHDSAKARVNPPLDQIPHLTTNLGAKPWRMSALLGHLARVPQDRLFPGVDIFHATDHLLPRLSRVKSVFTLHDLIFRFYPEAHKPLNRWFLTLMMPRFLSAANRVIAVSECTKRDAVRLYALDEAKIEVIYEGVNPRFSPAPREAIPAICQKHDLPESFVLCVSTIEPRKNLTSLLEAYNALRDREAEHKLVIVGQKGWLYGGFFRRLRELGLGEEVFLPGFVPDEDLPAFYSAADLFVFPSLYEGFGLPVLEAMACGTPVITSDTSSLPEVAGEAALLVDPSSVQQLTQAMQRVLESKELHAELRVKGIQQAAKFTWERTARQTLDIYAKVLTG